MLQSDGCPQEAGSKRQWKSSGERSLTLFLYMQQAVQEPGPPENHQAGSTAICRRVSPVNDPPGAAQIHRPTGLHLIPATEQSWPRSSRRGRERRGVEQTKMESQRDGTVWRTQRGCREKGDRGITEDREKDEDEQIANGDWGMTGGGRKTTTTQVTAGGNRWKETERTKGSRWHRNAKEMGPLVQSQTTKEWWSGKTSFLSPCVDTPPPPQSSRTRAQCSQRVVSVRTVHGAQYQSCQLVSSEAFFSCPSV